MVESPIMFQSYKASLEGLQKKSAQNIPFVPELVFKLPSIPTECIVNMVVTLSLFFFDNVIYITQDTEIRWESIVHDTPCNLVSDMDEVFASEDIRLDSSQREAIRHVLSSRVAIIQVLLPLFLSSIVFIIIRVLQELERAM